MNKKNWIDKLDDKEILRLSSKKPKYKKIPFFLDNKILNIIQDKEKIIQKRRKIYIIKYTKYAFALITLLLVISFSFFYFFKNILSPDYNKCFITELNGISYIKNKTGKIKNIHKIPYRIKESYTIYTKENSNLNLKIGSKSIIKLNELSELKVVKIFQKKEIEKINLFVNSGEINFKPELLSQNSTFQVETEIITINVTGTEFVVRVDDKKNTNVYVKEGSIFIKPKIKLSSIKKIKNIDQDLYEKLNNILFSGLKLNQDQSIEILYSDFKDIESKINEIINSIYIELNQNKNYNEKIKEITILKNNLFKIISKTSSINESEIKKQEFIIFKIPSSISLSLTEKNTSITSDNNNLYISSDSNRAIYSINTLNGTIKWKYTNPEIKDITSALIPFKNSLVLGTSNSIIILDKNGKQILKKELKNGVTYWAKSIVIKDKIFIPTNKNIYIFDGKNINKIESLPESSGQLYISFYNNKLFCFASNELIIKIFDLINNKIIWTSSKLSNRAFINPLIINNFIYITDIKNNLYKFDYIKNNTPQIINIGTGNLTNIINYNEKFFFIGTNGYFYILSNNTPKKVIKVDIQPEINKYLTKQIIKYNNFLLFSSDTGNIFYYNIINNQTKLLKIPENIKKLPLIGTPVIINNFIYFIDTESNIYRLSINL